jgi:repressor of nif and glnA expression
MEVLTFSDAKVEKCMYSTTFDPDKMDGKVIINICTLPVEFVDDGLRALKDAIYYGLSVAPYVKIQEEGHEHVKFLTICSITICGVILKKGIPVKPKLGGVVQVEDGVPKRFTDIILYRSSTIDPLLALLSHTSVDNVVKNNSGKMLANFHEVTMFAKNSLEDVLEELLEIEFSGVLEVGEANREVLNMAVEDGHVGFSLVGGTNPMALMKERGIPIKCNAIAGMIEFSELVHIDDI